MPYLPNTEADIEAMLRRIGVKSFEELVADIPQEIRDQAEIQLPAGLSELETVEKIGNLAQLNRPASKMISFLGGGAYDHYVPAAVEHILLRSEFYTAYTPYQAEVSQGTLQAIYEFQSLIAALTGMDVANASMYDGATALAEGGLMACHHTKRKKLVVSSLVNPQYRQVLKTYSQGLGIELAEFSRKDGVTDLDSLKSKLDGNTASVLVQHPNFLGFLEPVEEMAELTHKAGALLVVSADPISLAILKPPGQYGADIATGEGQPLGMAVSFGGPHLGLFAARQELLRLMPGRIVGLTTDAKGRQGLVLTMQAREQHIRREKATSNICSNQALCALAATVYLSLLGRSGLKKVAELCLQKAHYLSQKLTPAFPSPFFREFAVKVDGLDAKLAVLEKEGILGGIKLERHYPEMKGHLLVAVTEKRTQEEMDRLVAGLADA
jgi:glycine dehydrogenase subunit 1